MMTASRYVIVTVFLFVLLHYILTISHEGYSRATSISRLLGSSQTPSAYDIPEDYFAPSDEQSSSRRKANATMVMLARNSDVNGVVQSMKEIENSFNKEFIYPWVFLNDVPFSDEFMKRTAEIASGPVEFGLIASDFWNQPNWIDEEKARAGRQKMQDDHIIYGESVSYRNMCRFNSGFFFRHELLEKYRWYWRVEPDVHFYCDLHYDPFLYLEDNNKVYGFTITLYEFRATIESLWQTVKDFISANPQYLAPNNAMKFLSDDDGNEYNLCHFWSNFEIADMDFWRGEAYQKFFDHLEKQGGFYYERWGDAPVHSIAAALFANKTQIHNFNDIGYRHGPYQHCPQGELHRIGKCACDENDNFDYDGYSCLPRWNALWD